MNGVLLELPAQMAVLGHFMVDDRFAKKIATSAINFFLHDVRTDQLLKWMVSYRKKYGRPPTKEEMRQILFDRFTDENNCRKYDDLLDQSLQAISKFDSKFLLRKLYDQSRAVDIRKHVIDLAAAFNRYSDTEDPKIERAMIEHAQKIADAHKIVHGVELPSLEDQKFQMDEEATIRRASIPNSLPLVNGLQNHLYMVPPGLTAIGGPTGSGKSSTSGNMVCSTLDHKPNAKILILSNEETSDQVLSRIACLRLGVDVNSYIMGSLDLGVPKSAEVDAEKIRLLDQIVVVAGTNVNGLDTTCLEDVQNLLHEVVSSEDRYDLIILDYLQTVRESKCFRDTEFKPMQVSKALGTFLKEYAKQVTIPIVVFVQLRPVASNAKVYEDFAARVVGDKTFAFHCHSLIEIQFNKESLITTFVVHKNRFGTRQNVKLLNRLIRGRYMPVPITNEYGAPPLKAARSR